MKKEFENAEYYITTHCDSVTEALKMFAQDELVCKPGEELSLSSAYPSPSPSPALVPALALALALP